MLSRKLKSDMCLSITVRNGIVYRVGPAVLRMDGKEASRPEKVMPKATSSEAALEPKLRVNAACANTARVNSVGRTGSGTC